MNRTLRSHTRKKIGTAEANLAEGRPDSPGKASYTVNKAMKKKKSRGLKQSRKARSSPWKGIS